MFKSPIIPVIISALFFNPLASFTVSPQKAHLIANKIWHNECAGTVTGLTNWKEGESFASLGIGHFIWYPAGNQECFKESFPELLQFLQKQGVKLPVWLTPTTPCPWGSRAEFNQNFDSPKMVELRQFLLKTKDLQARFIARKLEKTFPSLLKNLAEPEKSQIRTKFLRLAETPQGLYALIDYLNFKGAGTATSETYKHQGWGLLQVLQRVPLETKRPVHDFIDAAKAVLTERVKNSPPARNEDRWLKGWFNRLDTYKKPV